MPRDAYSFDLSRQLGLGKLSEQVVLYGNHPLPRCRVSPHGPAAFTLDHPYRLAAQHYRLGQQTRKPVRNVKHDAVAAVILRITTDSDDSVVTTAHELFAQARLLEFKVSLRIGTSLVA